MQRDTRRNAGPRQLGDVLHEFLAQSGIEQGLSGADARRAWAQALGPLAERARAVRFQRGELVVEVQSSAHLAELQNFTGEDYRRAANRKLGRDLIQRVVFQQKR